MSIRFYNTLTHKVEEFAPITPGRVLMYNCGPTVYDFAHIGNFRAFVFADLVRRFLEITGHQVLQVMNITDVGHMTEDDVADGAGQDKMAVAGERLKEAKKSGKLPPGSVENPDNPYEVADYYARAFVEDARALRLKIADEPATHRPRATQHIAGMQGLIARLIENKHAYVGADHSVYFDVQSFPDYGKLSGNTIDKLRSGAGGRVLEEHQAVKRHPVDFLLWKPDGSHLMKWDSPWGAGYPGWHIECSAMALTVLSQLAGQPVEMIDIHTGGEDNIFPHHECEIAQTCGATGQAHFARHWMHTRFLLVEGQKMSKRKGNFYTVRDVLEGRATGRSVDPAVLRYELAKAHYRSNMNFTLQGLQDAGAAVQKLRSLEAQLTELCKSPRIDVSAQEVADHPTVQAFTAALADDLNMAGAMAEVFGWLGEPRDRPEVSLAVLRQLDQVLGVLGGAGSTADGGDDGFAAEKCAALDVARKNKDFAAADKLRQELIAAGYDVQTGKGGTTAKKKLA